MSEILCISSFKPAIGFQLLLFNYDDKLFGYLMAMANQSVIRDGFLAFKETTWRKTKSFTLKHRSWPKSMDAPRRNSPLRGFLVKAMVLYLSLVCAALLPNQPRVI
jgi:hypothetical protein